MSRLGLSRNQVIGVAVTVIGTIVWVFAFTGGFGGLFAASTYTVKANFTNVEDIVQNDPVRINGVDIGTVQGVSAQGSTNAGTITMSIESQYHIHNDASASLVWRTILGGNDVINIDPGTADAGPLQGPIPASRNSNQVELDEVLLPFHDGAQSGLQTMLNQLGPALSSHFDLANDLNLYRGIAPTADIAGRAVRGVEPDTDLRNLVSNAGRAAQAMSVGTDAATTRQFVSSAANTLAAFGGNQASFRATIRGLTQVYLDNEHWVWPQYNVLLYKVDRIVRTLHGSAPQIAPALRQFDPTLQNAHTLLADATPLVHKLSPALDSLAATAKVAIPVIHQLNPGLTALAKTTLPGLAAKYPEEGGRTVYQLIGPTVNGIDISNFFNSDGTLANLTAGLEEVNNEQQFLPCALDFSHTDFLVCSSLSNALQDFFSGGSSLLQGLMRRPGAAPVYAPYLRSAQRAESGLANLQQKLSQLAPSVAKFLFAKNHGGLK